MEKASKKIVKCIIKYLDNPSEEDIEIAMYGIESLLINIYKIPILLSVAYILGVLKYYIITTLVFSVIKMNSWGIHMRTGISCISTTLISFLSIIYISIYIKMGVACKLILAVLSIIGLYRYAPADTEERPCLSDIRRRKQKVRSVMIGVVYSICSFIYPDKIIADIFILVLFFQAICILPHTYKIFNRRYNNYEYY